MMTPRPRCPVFDISHPFFWFLDSGPSRLDDALVRGVLVHALGDLTQSAGVEAQALLVPVLHVHVPGHGGDLGHDFLLLLVAVVVVVGPRETHLVSSLVLAVVPGGRLELPHVLVHAGVVPDDGRAQTHRVQLLGHGRVTVGLDARARRDERAKVLAGGKGGAGESAKRHHGVGPRQLQTRLRILIGVLLGALLGVLLGALIRVVRSVELETLSTANGAVGLLPHRRHLRPGAFRPFAPELRGEGRGGERPAECVDVPGRLVHLVVRGAVDGVELGVHGVGDSLLVGDARADVLRLLDDPLLLLGGFLSLLGDILGDGRALLNLGGGGDSLTLPLDGSLARGLGLGGESLNLAGLRVGLFREGDHLRLRRFLLRSHLSHLVEELRLFLEQALRVFRACHRGGHLDLPRYRVLLSLRQLPESKLELGARRHRLAFPIRGVFFGNREILGENGDGVSHLDRLPGELLDVLVHALLEHGDRRHLLELGVGRRQVRLGCFVPRRGGCEVVGGELRIRLGALLNLLADALGGGDAHLRSLQGLGHLVSHRRLRRLRLGHRPDLVRLGPRGVLGGSLRACGGGHGEALVEEEGVRAVVVVALLAGVEDDEGEAVAGSAGQRDLDRVAVRAER
mmetsp:Transcript_10965/g.50650  ORF Transcript_10965/g.50650 Transcript_10965/m.50650 type:complete len:626 (+) Transcript_10965:124-2001(+)